jgi:membrane-associated phospholipid phosphatase
MIKYIIKPLYFWGIVGFASLLLLLLMLAFPKQESFLLIQLPRNTFYNLLFHAFTFIGDGVFTICIVLLLAIYLSYRYAIILLSSYISGSLLVQLTKQILIPNNPRPVKWFEINQINLQLPADLSPYLWYSFPSGHSASAASLAFCLVLIFHKKWQQVLIAVVLICVGYSRIYRYMHFPEDVLAGFSFGFAAAIASFYFFTKLFASKNIIWADKRILKK